MNCLQKALSSPEFMKKFTEILYQVTITIYKITHFLYCVLNFVQVPEKA